MKSLPLVLCLLVAVGTANGEDRFGRPVVKVKDQKAYQFTKLDDVEYPGLSNDRYSVTCLVYRGTQNYYVEVNIKNKTPEPIAVPMNFITFNKVGYTVYRTDTMSVARQAASAAGVRFQPTPPPYVPPTEHTTIDGTATTNGNQTQISATATTTTDNSGQAGANLGNAIGNAIAAHRFYKAQRNEVTLSHYLAAHLQTDADSPIQAGDSRVIVVTFEQTKQKKAAFEVTMQIGADDFRFAYKE